jgi:hypothetical protein
MRAARALLLVLVLLACPAPAALAAGGGDGAWRRSPVASAPAPCRKGTVCATSALLRLHGGGLSAGPARRQTIHSMPRAKSMKQVRKEPCAVLTPWAAPPTLPSAGSRPACGRMLQVVCYGRDARATLTAGGVEPGAVSSRVGGRVRRQDARH